MPELWRDIDKVKNTPHMNWSDCPCTQCSIWRIVAALQRAEAERDDLAEQLDLAFEMQREYLARAERAEAAIARMSVHQQCGGNWVCGTCGTALGDES